MSVAPPHQLRPGATPAQ